jgi:hypothetical protein
MLTYVYVKQDRVTNEPGSVDEYNERMVAAVKLQSTERSVIQVLLCRRLRTGLGVELEGEEGTCAAV